MFPEHRKEDLAVLTFNVTWFCPVRCSYCYRAMQVSRKDRRVLSKEDLIRECRLARQYGIDSYRFSGGEPLILGDKLLEYADIVYDLTGQKPVVLTSGLGIDETWLKKARNKFGMIAVSVENPIDPLQSVVDPKRMLSIIKEHLSDELPFRFGLTLVSAPHFADIETIFDMLYESVDKHFMPQLDYPCLGNFIPPSPKELAALSKSTTALFQKYGAILYYFVYMVGSLLWLAKDQYRIVLNLHPEGTYQIYESLLERWQVEYRWLTYLRQQQTSSETCQNCEWLDACRHHPYYMLRYDWCDLRKAIFQGMFDGLGVTADTELNPLSSIAGSTTNVEDSA